MADDVDENRPIYKGSVWPVTIKDVLPDLLVVCLKHGAKVYRGILLDSVKRDLPPGVNFPMGALKGGMANEKGGNGGSESNVATATANPPEMSALVNRHTYSLEPGTEPIGPQVLPPPRKELSRPLRGQNVRNMRLRPRQVLCTKCKQGIHETQVQPTKSIVPEKPAEKPAEPEPPKPQERYETRKRRMVVALECLPIDPPKKCRKLLNSKCMQSNPKPVEESSKAVVNLSKACVNLSKSGVSSTKLCPTSLSKPASNPSKSSPVIKISFAGPKGHGTVVEIPSKPNIPQISDSDESKNSPALSQDMSAEEYRKFRKAQKRAERKSREDCDTDSVASLEQPAPSVSLARRKKSKRTKHKLKRKHKHRSPKKQDDADGENKNHDESFKENEQSRTPIVIDQGEESSLVDNMVMYAGNEDINDCQSSRFPSDFPTKDSEDQDEKEGLVVLSPRHNLMFDCDNIKLGSPSIGTPNLGTPSLGTPNGGTPSLGTPNGGTPSSGTPNRGSPSLGTPNGGTPSKNSDSSSESSQDYDLDFPEVGKNFFKSSPYENRDDLSDSPYDHDRENVDAEYSSDFPEDRSSQTIRPLMFRIQNLHVNKVLLDDGRTFRNGDVIWGKIHGFPWWPGRIMNLTESLKDNGIIINQTAQISWYASSTMSHMSCTELYPFLEDFKLRYNKKKKGSYKVAVKQASIVAHTIASEVGNGTPEFHEVSMDSLDS